MEIKAILNLSLRGGEIIGKFLLTLILAKLGGPKIIGDFNIFSTTLNISYLLIGVDFYTFTHREIIKTDIQSRSKKLIWHFAFCSVLYLLSITILFLFGALNLKISVFNPLIWFIPLLLFEWFNQELFRVFILFEFVSIAYLLNFIRNALWIPFFGFFAYNKTIDLNSILFFWSLFSAIAFILGFIFIFKIKIINSLALSDIIGIDFSWVKKGLSISMLFIIGTIFLKIIEFSNRYLLDFLTTKEEVGLFSFYGQFANSIGIFVNVTIISVLYSKLLKHSDDFNMLHVIAWGALKKIVLSFILLTPLVFSILYFIILKLKYDVLFENQIYLFVLLTISTLFNNLAVLYSTVLYALGRDKNILKIYFISGSISLILNYGFIYILGIIGATISAILCFLLLFLLNYRYAKISL